MGWRNGFPPHEKDEWVFIAKKISGNSKMHAYLHFLQMRWRKLLKNANVFGCNY